MSTTEALVRDLATLVTAGGNHGTTIKGTQRPTGTAPKGWDPGVQYADGRMTVQTPGMEENVQGDPSAWRAIVARMGLEVPHGWVVVLREAKFDPAAWHRDEEFIEWPDADERASGNKPTSRFTKAPAVTRPVWRYRFTVEPDTGQLHHDDVQALWVEQMKRRPKKRPATPEDAPRRALNVVYADPQAGKVALLGGTEALIHRVGDTFDLLTDHLRDLKKIGRLPTEATWIDGGDTCEGFNNVASQKYTNDLTMTQQVRFSRRVQDHGLTFLAERFNAVKAATCGSNHNQVREGKDPIGPPDNDWGIEVMSQIQDGFAKNPDAFGHVNFAYPHQWRDTLALDSGGLQIGLAHGHQFKNGSDRAVADWWRGQTFGDQPVAHAQVLVSGHFHHFAAREMGNGRLWVQAPTLDNGSDWYSQIAGEVSSPGLMVFSTTEDGWDDLRILRADGEGWTAE